MGELIGSLAAVLTTCAFFPQVLKCVKTKSAEDLSAAWLLMMGFGIFLWVVYGLWIASFPILLSNIVIFVCLIVLMYYKFGMAR
ncbi:MAG: hypothetical protein H6Q73_3211 [Firmicutes bacterium]|nr:hypothetical protein [Bacillota bacterium]